MTNSDVEAVGEDGAGVVERVGETITGGESESACASYVKLKEGGCTRGLVWGVACSAIEADSEGWMDDIGEKGAVEEGGPATRMAADADAEG